MVRAVFQHLFDYVGPHKIWIQFMFVCGSLEAVLDLYFVSDSEGFLGSMCCSFSDLVGGRDQIVLHGLIQRTVLG